MRMIRLVAALCMLVAIPLAQAVDNMHAFPAADEGMIRYVLQLPKLDEESDSRVELIVGRTVEVDAGNRYFFAGKIEEQTITGWGFPRYLVSKLGPMAGTLMAIDPNAPKVKRFVMLAGEPFFVRYNSRLPIVVYAPEGVDVRYRVWSAAPEAKGMDKG
jgi:ecotin